MIARRARPGWPKLALTLFGLGFLSNIAVMAFDGSRWLLLPGAVWVILSAALALRDLERMMK